MVRFLNLAKLSMTWLIYSLLIGRPLSFNSPAISRFIEPGFIPDSVSSFFISACSSDSFFSPTFNVSINILLSTLPLTTKSTVSPRSTSIRVIVAALKIVPSNSFSKISSELISRTFALTTSPILSLDNMSGKPERALLSIFIKSLILNLYTPIYRHGIACLLIGALRKFASLIKINCITVSLFYVSDKCHISFISAKE